jgi:hypothetical protein
VKKEGNMTHARHTDALPLSILLLFALLALIALPSPASSQTVVDPRIVEFSPSADHDTTLPDGRPAVERYLLKVFQAGASQPFHTVDMGKPDADADGTVRFDFWATVAAWPLPGGNYVSRVDAVGPGGNGLSAPSNPFTFGSSCSCGLVAPTSASFPAAGGGGSVSVDAGDECDWTATASAGWIRLAAGGGTGSGSVIFNVDPNPNTTPRTGTIDVAGSTFTVTQAGVACSYTVSPASASVAAAAGSGSFTVSSSTGCSWTATSNAAWITLGTTSGSGNGTVSYTVAANTGTSARTGTVTAGGKTFTVTQAGATVTPPPTSPLPTPWQHRDIGLVGRAGDATASGGVFNVSGAGTAFTGTADAFHFAYRNAATEVIASLTSLSDDCPNGRAGVMLRENVGVSARFVAIVALPQGGFEVLHRVTPNSRPSVVARVTQGMLGSLRLVRNKKVITVYRSDDGTSWTQVATVNVKFTPTLGGLAVTSGSGNLLNAATFAQATAR